VIVGYDIRKSELLFILFLAILIFGDLSFENLKSYMMSSCMTKREFLPKPNMMFRIGNYRCYATCFALSLVKLCRCLMRGLSCS
jgi:hypothetical protein